VTVRRVLIVDDDPSVRNLLRMTLPVDGFEIVEAENGEEALSLIEGAVPDLVLLDWAMPGLSGGDVLAELKRRRPELPVIILTAEADPRFRAVSESLGVEAYLTKPFSPLQLLSEVERLLSPEPPPPID
jgi:CheY-like chemotaxis protein